MNITATTRLCMTIGDPVTHSLSPQMHNAGYESLGIDNEYVFVTCRVKPEDLAAFVAGAKAMHIRGMSCTMPHKLEIMQYLDEIDEVAQAIGAVNTVVNSNGRLTGYNTDWLGVVKPLEAMTSLKGKSVALVGAGGAARAAAYGVAKRGAELTIYNRTHQKAQQLADDFGGRARSMQQLEEVKHMDIIINATSVGSPYNNQLALLPNDFISDKQIVFDVVPLPYETELLKAAQQQGAKVVHGLEMILQQGLAQFKLFTGREAPEAAMRDALLQALQVQGDRS